MSHHLHLLPAANFPRPPAGYVNRDRVAVDGADLDTLDAEVAAVGGHIAYADVESRSVGRGPWQRQRRRICWYVIPADALDSNSAPDA